MLVFTAGASWTRLQRTGGRVEARRRRNGVTVWTRIKTNVRV